MNPPSRPGRGLTPTLPNANLRPEIGRIEYGIFTRADCGLAWKIFADCERWSNFLDAYSSFRWQGAPWTPGSRLHIELVRPIAAKLERVVTICTPPRCVAWINHVLGYTMEQWVLFNPHPGGGTRVSTWIEFTGPALHVDGHGMSEIIQSFVEEWYGNFRAECDRLARGQ